MQVHALHAEEKEGTDHYIDGIRVNECVVPVDRVRRLLLCYRLVTKEPQSLCDAMYWV